MPIALGPWWTLIKSFSEADIELLFLALDITRYGLSAPQQKPDLLFSLAEHLKFTSLLDSATASALTIILPLILLLFGRFKSPIYVYFEDDINLPKVNSQSPIWSTL